MRKVREVFRLKWGCNLSVRSIARSCNISKTVVAEYLTRWDKAGLSWPLSDDMDDGTLENLLFPSEAPKNKERSIPDWSYIKKELRNKHVTLTLLWHEYKDANPEGYQYSWFCDMYREWAGRLDLSMRQEHKAGEKTFVDYAGSTVPVADGKGGIRAAYIFIAVLGASNYTYAEATWTQSLPDWIESHVNAFTYFGGVSEIVVPDNLKSGVESPCRYEPLLNLTYEDLMRHYKTCAIPARVRKAKDKAKVETGVLIVYRWILARLRKRKFFSLTELNHAIRQLLVELNERPFKKLPGSRRSMFEDIDRPALKPLPSEPYIYATWKKGTVHIDYHVEVDKHYYSVPYQLYKSVLDIRLTKRTVEFFHKNRRVASHQRSYHPHRHTTLVEHMPKAHKSYAEWTPERIIRWARKAGPYTVGVIERVMSSRIHPQQAFRSCLGIMRLGKTYGDDRLEAACERAHRNNLKGFRSINSILKSGLDKQPFPQKITTKTITHPNIRGAEYYKGEETC